MFVLLPGIIKRDNVSLTRTVELRGKKMQLYSIFKYISVSFASIFLKKHEFSTHFYSAFSFTSIEIAIERIFNEFACLTSATQAKRAELVKQ